MLRRKEGKIEWLEYELLADCKGIDHRVFLKHGGDSEGAYQSLNFSSTMGDNPHHVSANFRKVQALLGCGPIVTASQRHGKEIIPIDDANKHHSFVGDALTTRTTGVPLLVRHADCQAACFYDPVHHAVSLVHCGWRGSVQNIYAETVAVMQKRYGSQPENLFVCISPSLGPERSEFINYKAELPESFWQFQFKPYYFDLWAITEWQLKNAGILSHHMQLAQICTWNTPQDYFSFRRSRIMGNNGSLVLLKSLTI